MATPKSVAFHTLGCKLNYSETSSIQRLFEDKGFFINNFDDQADVYVINIIDKKAFILEKPLDRRCFGIIQLATKRMKCD